MKLVKSLFLGSVAGLAAVAGAQAADLPVKKAAAVEYVRVCSTYGAGFFYIPGTETCLRISGRVRAEMAYLEPNTREDDAIGFRGYGRLNFDTRTSTAYGLLRSYTRVLAQVRSGSPYGRDGAVDVTGLEQAYVQFGGLTAGRVTSFFSNPDLPNTNMGTLRFDDSPDVNLFAYTFSFGNGFSATLALEDGLERRNSGATQFGLDDAAIIDYAGQRIPDVVANLKYTGTWGGAQLSGALHQVRSDFVDVVGLGTIAPDTEYGFAIGASAYVNLPALAPDDALWVFATYARGASNYSGFGDVPDATVNPVTGDSDSTETWNIAAGFNHNWSPTVRSSLFGSYAQVEFANTAVVTAGGAAVGGFADFREWRIGGNTIWSPVSGLDIGVEVLYSDVDFRGALSPIARSALDRDLGAWEGRLRVQRDF
jgi:hypothetical protein